LCMNDSTGRSALAVQLIETALTQAASRTFPA
jgi:hypothetical protein